MFLKPEPPRSEAPKPESGQPVARTPDLDRRTFLAATASGAAVLALGGCDGPSGDPKVDTVLRSAEALNRDIQKWVTSPLSMAHEYAAKDISRTFKPNGTTAPDTEDYQALAEKKFVDWRLEVGGLVERPAKYSLAELRAMPSRTQITRHDCVEGWSCIGQWKGVPLSQLLQRAALKPQARFIVFRCADSMGNSLEGPQLYYESVDLEDAFHPQTILAYEMNGQPLPVPNGAPLRLRVERQLGYKMAKYLMKIEAVESFAAIGEGKGGYWEDQGYTWWAGI